MMARFCARIRKRDDVPTVSMKDVYTGLTIAGLVTLVAPAQSAPEAPPTGSRADIERIFAEALARSWVRTASRPTSISSMSWATTRWSWRGSAPACASATTSRRCR
jgi:hypothetical protein